MFSSQILLKLLTILSILEVLIFQKQDQFCSDTLIIEGLSCKCNLIYENWLGGFDFDVFCDQTNLSASDIFQINPIDKTRIGKDRILNLEITNQKIFRLENGKFSIVTSLRIEQIQLISDSIEFISPNWSRRRERDGKI